MSGLRGYEVSFPPWFIHIGVVVVEGPIGTEWLHVTAPYGGQVEETRKGVNELPYHSQSKPL